MHACTALTSDEWLVCAVRMSVMKPPCARLASASTRDAACATCPWLEHDHHTHTLTHMQPAASCQGERRGAGEKRDHCNHCTRQTAALVGHTHTHTDTTDTRGEGRGGEGAHAGTVEPSLFFDSTGLEMVLSGGAYTLPLMSDPMVLKSKPISLRGSLPCTFLYR